MYRFRIVRSLENSCILDIPRRKLGRLVAMATSIKRIPVRNNMSLIIEVVSAVKGATRVVDSC